MLGKHFFIVNKFPHGAAPMILSSLLLLFSTAVAAFNSNWFAWRRKTGAFYFADRPTPCDVASWIRNDFPEKKAKKVPKYSFSCAAVCVCSISKNCPLTRPYRNAIGNLYKNVYKMLYKMCARACNSALRPGKVGATLIKRGILDFIFIAVIMCASVAQHTVCTVYIIIYYYVLCTRVHLVFHRVIYFYAWNFVRNTDHRPSGLCSLRSV